jgi:mRNA-degrading endonuclease RelE of RelBE toxin-antitoxin system
VSASEIIKELPKLSEAERRAVLNKLRELAVRDEDVRLCEQAAGEQAAELDRLEEAAADYRAVDYAHVASARLRPAIFVLD